MSQSSGAPAGVSRITRRFADPYADPAEDRARLRFASALGVMGLLHCLIPSRFVTAVPRWLPYRRELVLWSGVAELTAAGLLAVPQTRKAGGWVATATIAAVYPANIQMAVDATRKGSKLAATATWLRLPMQLPMLVRAYRFTR